MRNKPGNISPKPKTPLLWLFGALLISFSAQASNILTTLSEPDQPEEGETLLYPDQEHSAEFIQLMSLQDVGIQKWILGKAPINLKAIQVSLSKYKESLTSTIQAQKDAIEKYKLEPVENGHAKKLEEMNNFLRQKEKDLRSIDEIAREYNRIVEEVMKSFQAESFCESDLATSIGDGVCEKHGVLFEQVVSFIRQIHLEKESTELRETQKTVATLQSEIKTLTTNITWKEQDLADAQRIIQELQHDLESQKANDQKKFQNMIILMGIFWLAAGGVGFALAYENGKKKLKALKRQQKTRTGERVIRLSLNQKWWIMSTTRVDT